MIVGINCGHTVGGQAGSGAVGILEESRETRRVGYALMEQLRRRGVQVVDCTNDQAASTAENLSQIVAMANAQPLDAFYSIHFNAGGGEGSEVYTNQGRNVLEAETILENLSALGFPDRGIKDGSRLYVIRRTEAPAALIEVCFVDNRADADRYLNLGAERVAEAICQGIAGEKEELTMSQYQELKDEIRALTETVKILATEVGDLKNPMIYNYIDDNMPGWARASVQKAVDLGVLQGTGEGLNLREEDLRHIVWNDRAGLYDR